MSVVVLTGVLAASVAACGSSGSDAADRNVAFNQLPPCPMDALDKATKPVEITMWERKAVEQTNALQELAKQFNESQKQVHVNVQLGDSTAQVYEGYKAVNGLVGADKAVA